MALKKRTRPRNGSSKKRRIKGELIHAKQIPRPPFTKNNKLKGLPAAGLRFQTKVDKYLSARMGDEFYPSPWYRFTDSNGTGMCSPDFLIIPEELDLPIVVGECKLTVTPNARKELENLYLPIVRFLYPGRIVRGAQVASNMRHDWVGPLTEDWNSLYEGYEFITLRWRT